MKRRVISLLLALMMLMSAAAVAETAADSTLYTMGLYNPGVYANGELMIDLTGLELDFSLAASDSGTNAVIVDLLAGENFDYVTGVQAQLDGNGLSFYLDGMSNAYTIDLDQYLPLIDASLEGVKLGDITAGLPVRTLLSIVDLSGMSFEADLSGEARFALVEAIGSMVAYDTLVNGDSTEYAFSITAEESKAVLEMIAEQAEAQSADLDVEVLNNVALELSGKLVVTSATQIFNAAGKLWFDYAADRYADVTVTYSDDKTNANLSIQAVNAADEDDAVVISGTAVSTAAADGRISTEYNVNVSDTEESLIQFYAAELPVEGSAQIDYGVEAYLPEDELSAGVYWSANTYAEGEGFYVELSATEYDETAGVYALYEGDVLEDPSIGEYRDGYFQAGFYSGEESFDIATGVILMSQDLAVADWAYDSTGAINIENMTENETNAAAMGLMGVLGTAMSALQTSVPGLAPYLEAAMSSLMG